MAAYEEFLQPLHHPLPANFLPLPPALMQKPKAFTDAVHVKAA